MQQQVPHLKGLRPKKPYAARDKKQDTARLVRGTQGQRAALGSESRAVEKQQQEQQQQPGAAAAQRSKPKQSSLFRSGDLHAYSSSMVGHVIWSSKGRSLARYLEQHDLDFLL